MAEHNIFSVLFSVGNVLTLVGHDVTRDETVERVLTVTKENVGDLERAFDAGAFWVKTAVAPKQETERA